MPTVYQAPAKPKKPMTPSPKAQTTKAPVQMTGLACYVERPVGIRFETQAEDEEVILFLRQHIVVLVPWVLLFAVMLLAPTLVFPMVFVALKLPFAIPVGYLIVGTLAWYLATFGIALAVFIGWFFNIYIVTDRRAVDIDFVHLLYKEFSEADLSKIQDITYSTGGIIAAFFNYGNVLVQTAAEQQDIEFFRVPNPDKVVQTISALIKQQKEGDSL